MNKLDYLMLSFNDRAWSKKAFLISICAIVPESENEKIGRVPYGLQRNYANNECYFINKETGEKIVIDGADCNKPLFVKNEPITLSPEKTSFIKNKVETTFGRFLLYVVVIHWALKGKVEFVNKEITDGDLKKLIRDMMADNPKDGETIPDNKASVDECLKLSKQMDYLEGLNNIFVKAASLDAFTIDPKIREAKVKLVDELRKEGKANDPVALAGVIDKLVAEDRKIQLAGPSRDLYISDGFISNNRKKMFIIFGAEPNFHTGEYQLLERSLDEGWDMDKLTAYSNDAISGSYSRSISVALAGADVKSAIRLTGNIKAIKGDCQSTRGELVKITKYNFGMWVDSYYITDSGITKINVDDFNKLENKTIELRVPQYCQQDKGNLCSVCCGDRLGGSENRISSSTALIYTRNMLLSMKAMHVSMLVTKRINLKDIIR